MPQAIPASMVRKGELVKHPCGHYFQTMPVDEVTGLAAIPFSDAEDRGFFKIDFLHLSVLDHFTSKDQIRDLVNVQPDWSLLTNPSVVDQLFHLKKHYGLLAQLKPTSVQELADVLALIRPGKRDLLPQYMRNKEATRPLLYASTGDAYSFKRSHAISYALTIVLQLHQLANSRK